MIKKFKVVILSLVTSVLCMFLFAGHAFAINDVDKIIPTPQNVTYTENFMTIHNGTSFSACIVKGAKAPQAELEGVYFLRDAVSRLCGASIPVIDDTGDYSAYSTIITIGTTGSNALNNNLITANSISIPENMEGYAVRKVVNGGKNYVVIAGREAIGCYYGVTSVAQMIGKSGSNVQVREVTINDWPSLSIRALKDITGGGEGDFTLSDAMEWMKFLPMTKMNVFSLCYTHVLPGWRNPSQAFKDTVAAMGNYERDRGIIKTMIEVNSGLTGGLPVNDAEKMQLVNTYKYGLDNGMSQILSAFDDGTSTDANFHRDLSNYIYDRLKGQEGFNMLTCPQAYNFDYSNISTYLNAFTNGLKYQSNVVWTGNELWSHYTAPAHVNQWKSYTNPPSLWIPFYWHNDPVLMGTTINRAYQQASTYYFTDQKVPFQGVNLNGGYIWKYMPQYTDQGVIENVFRQFTTHKIYAISLADWMWNPAAYENTAAEFARAKRYWDTLVSNPAFNKTATASSSFDASYGAGKAIDGLTSHRGPANAWATAMGQTVGAWWKVDLGGMRTGITGIKLAYREFPSGIAYKIPKTVTVQVSNDGTTWNTMVSKSTNVPVEGSSYNSELYYYRFSAVDTRYVRVLFEDGTQNTSENLIEISEAEIVNEQVVTSASNLALNKTATASSEFSATYSASKAVDGTTSRQSSENCWATASGQHVGAWWRIDLGSIIDFRTIRLKFREHPTNTAYCVPKTITIQTSNDGTNWTSLITRSANVPSEGAPYTSQAYSYAVNGSGRYVRLLFEDGSQNNSIIEISEVEITKSEVPAHQSQTGNHAYKKVASASSVYNANYNASKVNDGKTSRTEKENCWATASGQTVGSWWKVDLGSSRSISKVDVVFREYPYGLAYCIPRTITFQVSDDGTTWTTVISKSANVPAEGSSYQSQKYSYSLNSSGRYVRLLFEDGSQGPLVELSEVDIK